MTITTAITLADNAAFSAWDSAKLGTFDASSKLVSKIDADDDGLITEKEISDYKKSISQKTDNMAYEIVDMDEPPESDVDKAKTLKQCLSSFNDMSFLVDNLLLKVSKKANQRLTNDTKNGNTALADEIEKANAEFNQVKSDCQATSDFIEKISDKSGPPLRGYITNLKAAATIIGKDTESHIELRNIDLIALKSKQ